MIKKVIIKILFVFMLTAFSAVVVVQWLWIKYAIRERESKFSSGVYDVLYRVVNRIDDINYMKYLREMQQQLGEIQSYNNLLSASESGSSNTWNSTYLSDFLHNDINRLNTERSYLSSPNATYAPRSSVGKSVNQEFIVQTIRSIGLAKDASGSSVDFHVLNNVLKEFMIRLVKEKDPQNVSIRKRLENIDLHNLLSGNFRTSHLKLPFTYEILTKQDLLKKINDRKTKNFYYVDLFPHDYVPKDYYLGVHFESVQSVILENMGWLFLSSGFCIFGLLFVFIITLMIIMRQQKLSTVKNDFINNMTHEFKTPIATISLATSAILKEKVLSDKEQVLKFNTIIKNENDRMNKYVERILQQAKIDRKEIHLNKTDVDMNELVREAVGHFMLQVQNVGGVLNYHWETENVIMNVDEVHILNVVCNLLDNAIKYSTDAPEIDVYTRLNEGEYIISVKDDGIGISKEAQKKVFKRFYRVNTGNLHNVKGFGLGLSYVKSIVELHDGTIRLSSKKNKGTLVEIIFNIE